MTKRTGKGYSSSVESVQGSISHYIQKTNKRGHLDSSARLFIAMALGQSMKDCGCSLTELCYLSDMAKGKVKSALASLGSLRLTSIASTRFLVLTKTKAKFYLPSKWARGRRTVEKISGPRPESYMLELADGAVLMPLLQETVKELTPREFLNEVRIIVGKSSESTWKGYVKFSRLLLNDITETMLRAKSLYGEFLPRKLEADIEAVYAALKEIEEKIDERNYVIGLTGEIEHRLLKTEK